MEAKRPEFKDGEEHYNEIILNQVKSALKKNGFRVKIFKSSKEAVEWFMNKLKDDDVVGVGGSRTLLQIGLIDELIKSKRVKFLNRWREGITPNEELATRHKNLSADVFISSSNAITLNGKLVNIDGMGNRVAAQIFGPKKVYMFVGRNKIVKDVEAGIWRTRNIAAAKNAARYKLQTPCTETGMCDEPNCTGVRICNFLVITERAFKSGRINIILIDEDLGF